MNDRRYTIEEIDKMRDAVRWMIPPGVSYGPGEMSAEIEDRLRTYMMAGVTPDDLEKRVKDSLQARSEHRSKVMDYLPPHRG